MSSRGPRSRTLGLGNSQRLCAQSQSCSLTQAHFLYVLNQFSAVGEVLGLQSTKIWGTSLPSGRPALTFLCLLVQVTFYTISLLSTTQISSRKKYAQKQQRLLDHSQEDPPGMSLSPASAGLSPALCLTRTRSQV